MKNGPERDEEICLVLKPLVIQTVLIPSQGWGFAMFCCDFQQEWLVSLGICLEKCLVFNLELSWSSHYQSSEYSWTSVNHLSPFVRTGLVYQGQTSQAVAEVSEAQGNEDISHPMWTSPVQCCSVLYGANGLNSGSARLPVSSFSGFHTLLDEVNNLLCYLIGRWQFYWLFCIWMVKLVFIFSKC